MDEEYLLGLMLEIVRQSGMWLLEERGQVAPYGISIVGEHGEPASFFPEEHHPGAPFAELIELVAQGSEAKANAAMNETAAAIANAAVTPMAGLAIGAPASASGAETSA